MKKKDKVALKLQHPALLRMYDVAEQYMAKDGDLTVQLVGAIAHDEIMSLLSEDYRPEEVYDTVRATLLEEIMHDIERVTRVFLADAKTGEMSS